MWTKNDQDAADDLDRRDDAHRINSEMLPVSQVAAPRIINGYDDEHPRPEGLPLTHTERMRELREALRECAS